MASAAALIGSRPLDVLIAWLGVSPGAIGAVGGCTGSGISVAASFFCWRRGRGKGTVPSYLSLLVPIARA